MEGRRSSKRKSKVNREGFENGELRTFLELQDEEDVVAEEPQPNYTNREPATIKLQLRMDFKLKLHGPVSGKLYIWERAGAVVNVDEADKELQNKRLGGKVCCGGNPDNNKFFVVVE